MIRGKFINENIPIVKVMVGSDRAIQTPNFILDTGFTGDIQVTKKVAQDLGLEITGITQTTIANGQTISVKTALAYSTMEGVKRIVNILISENMPLVGINFLKKFNYKAIVDCKNKTVALKRVK